MSEAYRLEPAPLDEAWDRFVGASEEGSVFALSGYLKHVEARPAAYWCFRRQERRAAVLLLEGEPGAALLHDFVVYSGLMFGAPTNRQNRSQRASERHEIATFVAAELASRYRSLAFALAPAAVDIRAFLWHDWGGPGPKYRARVRYTSLVRLEGFREARTPEAVPLFGELASARRQEVRYAIRKGVATRRELDAGRFASFYAATMARQGIDVPGTTLEAMRRLIEGSHDAGLGRMYVAYTSAGDPGSMAYMGLDGRRAYYVFGANDPAHRDSHTGTAVLWDAFRLLSEEAVPEIDLEGVNSPRRGWFKLSFGGALVPYFELSLDSEPHR